MRYNVLLRAENQGGSSQAVEIHGYLARKGHVGVHGRSILGLFLRGHDRGVARVEVRGVLRRHTSRAPFGKAIGNFINSKVKMSRGPFENSRMGLLERLAETGDVRSYFRVDFRMMSAVRDV